MLGNWVDGAFFASLQDSQILALVGLRLTAAAFRPAVESARQEVQVHLIVLPRWPLSFPLNPSTAGCPTTPSTAPCRSRQAAARLLASIYHATLAWHALLPAVHMHNAVLCSAACTACPATWLIRFAPLVRVSSRYTLSLPVMSPAPAHRSGAPPAPSPSCRCCRWTATTSPARCPRFGGRRRP